MENKTDVKPKKRQTQQEFWDGQRASGLTQSQIVEATTSLPPIVPTSMRKASPLIKSYEGTFQKEGGVFSPTKFILQF
ncbi:MAG: hypothetical protein ACJAS1_007203 [Oleiphilaceae bacterium]|jgi:hypothetical protein